jgi:hypothetical protein
MRGADLDDERHAAPEAPGLDVALRGLSMIGDDEQTLAITRPIFDGLYEYYRRARSRCSSSSAHQAQVNRNCATSMRRTPSCFSPKLTNTLVGEITLFNFAENRQRLELAGFTVTASQPWYRNVVSYTLCTRRCRDTVGLS